MLSSARKHEQAAPDDLCDATNTVLTICDAFDTCISVHLTLSLGRGG
jgi:hypothetical protein